MEGRHPGTGRWLRPEGAGGGRGGGIDVTFSAPKSVSTVWALGDPWQREQIESAHARAVEQTIDHLREQVPVVRRRYRGQVVEEHAKDVIATEYRHTTARGSPAPRHRTRSCTATSSSPALYARTTGSWRSRRGRSSAAHESWERSTVLRSPRSWCGRGTRSSRAQARTAASRSPGSQGVVRGVLRALPRGHRRTTQRRAAPRARSSHRPRARRGPRRPRRHRQGRSDRRLNTRRAARRPPDARGRSLRLHRRAPRHRQPRAGRTDGSRSVWARADRADS